jgi:hypothetical protein
MAEKKYQGTDGMRGMDWPARKPRWKEKPSLQRCSCVQNSNHGPRRDNQSVRATKKESQSKVA